MVVFMKDKIKTLLDLIITSPLMSVVLCILSTIIICSLLHLQGLGQIFKIAGAFITLYALLFKIRRSKVRAENKLLSPAQLEIKQAKEKELRRYLWLGGYFMLYAFLSFDDTTETSTPQWLTILEYAFSIGVLMCIVLYALRIRPAAFNLIWQIFPVCLIPFDICDLVYGWTLEPQHFPVWAVIAIFAIACLLNAPSWYICFRLGYPKYDESEDMVLPTNNQ